MHPFKFLQRTSQVCSNCFRRLETRIEPNYVTNISGGLHHDYVPVRRTVPITEITFPDEHSVERSHGEWVCECGACSPHVVVRSASNPLTKEESRVVGWRIADRLDDVAGRNVDRDAFMRKLDELKTDPEVSNMDDEIFRRATDAGVAAEGAST